MCSLVYSKLNDASIKHNVFIINDNTNSLHFTQGIPIYAYHNHGYPNNNDNTIEYCELFSTGNNYYISVYYLSDYKFTPYINASLDIFYI